MKRAGLVFRFIIFVSILASALFLVVTAHSARVQTREVKLYFTDATMLRLVPVRMTIPAMQKERMAQRVLDELIKGRDDNPKIRRILPNVRRCLTVRVEDETAWVDIKQPVVETHPDGRDLEMLTVYSIVNTLTDIDGITTVRFKICGKVQKDFMGYLDMREYFVPDYFV